MTTHFPFSAVVAQDQLKLALLLNAVDPQLGGVLISGPRGTGKSTLARGLADIAGFAPEQFINLPLGASEEKLTGSLDLAKALGEGQLHFSPGLLARAHLGALYVDEVNLLADGLVDLLLDVAASGVNHIERDGISHSHPARFILVGTMNPDEGELRPQLLDRFALCVELDYQLTAAERVAVVQHRMAFDQNPAAFQQRYQASQQHLRRQVTTARTLLPGVILADAEQLAIAERCTAAGVEGLRADICLQRASRAYAAWTGQTKVDTDCIETVAELVLHHRRRPANQSNQAPPQAERQSATSPAEGDGGGNTDPLQPNAAGSWGEMPAQPVGFAGTHSNLEPFRRADTGGKKKLR